ncbi:phosphatidylglycerophosphatase A [Vibrio nigripulchritudo]|uniref:phosphatidylglycerophosphatase A family protein n=1 Tax=Vibrio nigripulchritudo TaxID=28173 RepID=UPI0005FA8308|nr:phosphatidylglycerophosphatase A [Vibrio nigripulchritudo]KJY69784.1 phosphatidylglycerophosphatase [Vibrio nigripulchritudo]BCL68125.1 phosphatidylglycerophosphatase A [Vibrio nigripulchritudo]BDU29453.1 phosphatidylglycerophosphatase A [Vibrio nigripulchritudo]
MNTTGKINLTRPHQFFALGFGLGLSPKLPGTVGALAALPFIYAASQMSLIGQVILGLFICIYGVLCCDRTAKEIGQKDPQVIVWDEVAGFYIAMIAFPFQWGYLLAAFFLFRAFDILKPYPISWADKKLKGGLGIMMDDILAGIAAWLCVLGFSTLGLL